MVVFANNHLFIALLSKPWGAERKILSQRQPAAVISMVVVNVFFTFVIYKSRFWMWRMGYYFYKKKCTDRNVVVAVLVVVFGHKPNS